MGALPAEKDRLFGAMRDARGLAAAQVAYNHLLFTRENARRSVGTRLYAGAAAHACVGVHDDRAGGFIPAQGPVFFARGDARSVRTLPAVHGAVFLAFMVPQYGDARARGIDDAKMRHGAPLLANPASHAPVFVEAEGASSYHREAAFL